MRMTLADFKRRFPDRPDPIPAEFAGKWIAWNDDRTKIVAHGSTLIEVQRDAEAAGFSDPIFHRVPKTPFLGGA